MNSLTSILRTNPGIIVSLTLMVGGAFVCGLVGLMMLRAGASLRPICWFAGFFALIVVPQFVVHVFIAANALKQEAPRVAALEQLAASTDPETRSAAAKLLFGPDANAQLVTDARNVFGEAFDQAELAPFAILPNGDTVLLARFKGSSAAEKAWVDYLHLSGLNQLGGKGDSQRGYAVTRPVGDRAFVLHLHNMVGVWTGADDIAIRQRMAAGGFKIPNRAPLAMSNISKPVEPASIKTNPTNPLRTAFVASALMAYLFLVVLYFFKGAAWAGSSAAQPGVAAVSAAELAGRLEAINLLDVPFRIERGAQPDEFFATWRYADAKWIDLARARGMKRTFRIRLLLDERHGVVRATDYAASYDWSAGRGGADLDWKSSLGIVFFQYEHQRVFGLQLDEHGRFKPELSYAYTFNLQEMKSPLIAATTRAGWTWQPTLWQGPTWLRWLTE